MTHRREVVVSVNTVVIMIPLFPYVTKTLHFLSMGQSEHALDEKSH